MQIKADLSVSGIMELQKQLEDYKKHLARKAELFIAELANVGIQVAKSNAGGFGKYIIFSMRTEPKIDGCKVIFYARDSASIISEWKTKDGIKTAEVSPLLMAEFGSGFKAENPMGIEDVGQGTFPNQKHAFDSGGWYWIDTNDVLHHSSGIAPTQPMYKASKAIRLNVQRIAKEVFKG